jgi:hypothetical protein
VPIEYRGVSRFDQVRFMGTGALKITQTNEESLTVDAPAYVMKHIISDVEDGVLTVGYKSPEVAPIRVFKEHISFYLSMKELLEIVVTGQGSVLVPDLDSDALRVEISGRGNVSLEHLTADNFKAIVHGPGRIWAEGDVEKQSIVVNGPGNIVTDRLMSDFAHVSLNGPGKVSVLATDELNVLINGEGEVTYGGFPCITQTIRGRGALNRWRRQSKR